MFLLADSRKAFEILEQSTWSWVILGALIGVFVCVAVWIRNRFRDDSDPAAGTDQMLLLASELRREGEISDEEFRNIESRLHPADDRDANATDTATLTSEPHTMTDH